MITETNLPPRRGAHVTAQGAGEGVMQLPSLAIHLIYRVYACSVLPWHVIVAEGDRAERAARHLVHLGLIRVWRHRKEATLTTAGRSEVYRRLGW